MQGTFPEVLALVLTCTQNDCCRRPMMSDTQNVLVCYKGGSSADIIRAELGAFKVEIAHKGTLTEKQKQLLEEQGMRLKT